MNPASSLAPPGPRPFPSSLGRLVLAAFALWLSVVALHRMEPRLRPEKGTELTLQLPSGETKAPSTLRAAAFLSGWKLPASHLFWIGTLQYYGDTLNARERYRRLFEYCTLTSDLNPHFLKPYELGAAVLAFQVGRPLEAVELLRRGIEANPSNVRLKLLLAAIGYMESDRYDTILPVLEGFVRSGDAPPMMVNILANTYQKAGRWEDAVRVWRWILNHAKDDEGRDVAARSLERLYAARKAATGKAAP